MGYVGHPVDLWSCGVTLYAMLCGCLPFEHANTSSLYKKIIAGNYSEPRHLSRDARDILRRILNTDARKRFTVPQIQSHAWSLANGGGAAGGRAAAGASATLLDETASLASWVPDSSLLERLERHGYAAATTAEELAEGRHTAATASYFLLRLKEIRDAPKAPAGTARTGALTDRGGAQPKPPAAPRAVLSARDGNTNAPRAVAAAAPKPAATPTRARRRAARASATPRRRASRARRRGKTSRRRCTRRRRQRSTRLSRWARRTPPRAPPPRTAPSRRVARTRREAATNGRRRRGCARRNASTSSRMRSSTPSTGRGRRRRARRIARRRPAAPPTARGTRRRARRRRPAPRHGADFRRGRYVSRSPCRRARTTRASTRGEPALPPARAPLDGARPRLSVIVQTRSEMA